MLLWKKLERKIRNILSNLRIIGKINCRESLSLSVKNIHKKYTCKDYSKCDQRNNSTHAILTNID